MVRNNSQVKVLLLTIKCSASRVESTKPFNQEVKVQSKQVFKLLKQPSRKFRGL